MIWSFEKQQQYSFHNNNIIIPTRFISIQASNIGYTFPSHRSLADRSTASVMKTALLQTIIRHLNAPSTGINNWNNYQDKPTGSTWKALEILTLLRTSWQRLMQIHKLAPSIHNSCNFYILSIKNLPYWTVVKVSNTMVEVVDRMLYWQVKKIDAQLALRMIIWQLMFCLASRIVNCFHLFGNWQKFF